MGLSLATPFVQLVYHGSEFMSIYDERINQLRALMKDKNIDAYIVCTQDFHSSEYVGDYFKEREYLSGFTGSAGTLVITYNKAALWTDGRYYLQAEEQLSVSNIKLMKMGQKNVDTIEEYLTKNFNDLIKTSNTVDSSCDDLKESYNKLNKFTIGFDGRTVNNHFAEHLKNKIKLNISIYADEDLVEAVWKDRPSLSANPVWELDFGYTGRTREEKLEALRKEMKKTDSDICVLASLDDIAWLLNLRGNDVEYNPVFLAYMIIGVNYAVLYANEVIFSDEIKKKLELVQIMIKPYNDIYMDITKIDSNKNVLVDYNKMNYRLIHLIPCECKIQNIQSPIMRMKAVKNSIECDNIRKAHLKDGIAVTKFMYWLKKNIGKIEITELSAAKKLEELRANQEGYIGASFAPIMAYGGHGAIVHYCATKESNVKLEKKGLLLSDTGGHYLEGTTDITRTYVLGTLESEEKTAFTLVLRGNLNLASARFKYGVTGIHLDILARQPLWENGLDYNHGTGHGVGYVLNVHEGPNCIGWQIKPNRINDTILEEGMVTSNEPGFYLTNEFGIRHENLILCKMLCETEYGKFMGFETLTLVPFDLEGIDKTLLSDREIDWLNEYHQYVYKMLSPYFEGDELKWLQMATKII